MRCSFDRSTEHPGLLEANMDLRLHTYQQHIERRLPVLGCLKQWSSVSRDDHGGPTCVSAVWDCGKSPLRWKSLCLHHDLGCTMILNVGA